MKKSIPTRKKKHSIEFHLLTIFPEIFDSYLNESLFRRAKEKGIITVFVHNLRDFSDERHRKVDDRPFGGGPGMVLQVGPIYRAVKTIMRGPRKKTRIILFGLRGSKFSAPIAKRFSGYERIICICGRYEGVDERVARYVAHEELSIGDYVLSGGELPALVVLEAVSRFVPGFLGTFESLEDIKGSFPTYTRPEKFFPGKSKKSWVVPKVLLSGNHRDVEEWRKQK